MIDIMKAQTKMLKRERYHIVKESKYLDSLKKNVENENVDLRRKINELVVAKL